jgi:hypothetical protein
MSDPRLIHLKRYAKWGCCRVVYNEVPYTELAPTMVGGFKYQAQHWVN